jgi:hypothetical protein
MRGLGAIAIVLTACVLFVDAAAARSKSSRLHHRRDAASQRVSKAGTEDGKDGAVTQLDAR